MNRPLLFLLILFLGVQAAAQQNVLVLKKNKKTLQYFWPGQFIAFQPDKYQWQKGEIMTIKNDSVFVRPRIITFHTYYYDTAYYPIQGYAIKEIYALPKTGLLVDYKDGKFQPVSYGGHMHWYWVKSGWIFRAGGIGFAGLHTINSLRQQDFPNKDTKKVLLASGALLAGGLFLKKAYSPLRRIRNRYHMEMIRL
jgi:hypothetical protein